MKNILFIIFLVTFTSCVKKEKSHFQFFEQYISYQKSLRKKYLNTGKLSILQGSLSEKQEDQLFKSKDGKLYIAVYSNSPGGSNISETKETEKKSNNHFYLKSQFEYSKFNKTDSYINERYVEYTNLPVLTYKDFFLWFSFLQKNEIEKISSGVPFYTFLCTYFDCNLKETSDYWQISITPNLKLKNLDGVFYTKITNFLEKANLEINVFGKNNLEYAKIFNSKSSYYFYMNKKNLISKNMESLTFKVNIEAKFYGLTINISNMQYKLNFSNKKNRFYVKGYYSNIPSYKVTGRLGYIIPTSLINLFIPGDIEGYFKDFFELRKNGNRGKGTNWSLTSNVLKDTMNVKSISGSEIPRQPFRFLSSGTENKDTNIFWTKLEEKILESFQ